jgi:DNA ligase-1
MVEGSDLTRNSYLDRTEILQAAIEEGKNVKIATRLVSDSAKEIEAFFEKAINEGTEGLVCKSISENSPYEAGKRGWMWIKWKRSYRSEMADTVDLVVVGAFAGRGRRAGTHGALLMAAYNEDDGTFDTVCKLGSGFTDEALAKLPEMLGPLLSKNRDKSVNALIKPDTWFVPGTVMEVIGDEITLSPVHTCAMGILREGSGLAIRFPRLVKYRGDRGPEDATTVKELVDLYRMQLKQV